LLPEKLIDTSKEEKEKEDTAAFVDAANFTHATDRQWI